MLHPGAVRAALWTGIVALGLASAAFGRESAAEVDALLKPDAFDEPAEFRSFVAGKKLPRPFAKVAKKVHEGDLVTYRQDREARVLEVIVTRYYEPTGLLQPVVDIRLPLTKEAIEFAKTEAVDAELPKLELKQK